MNKLSKLLLIGLCYSLPVNCFSSSPPATTLQVNGINSRYSSSVAPYKANINITGSGLAAVTQISWNCTMPNGADCPGSPYVWTSANWTRNFTRRSDTAASLSPWLLAKGDPAGTYNWRVTFSGAGQSVTRPFTVAYTSLAQSYPPLSATTAGNSRNSQSDLQNLEIQRLLTDLGYAPGPADGVIGRKTRLAIYEYQRSAGMEIDGQPSAKLLLSLRSHNLSSIGPNSNSRSLNTEEIIEIQQILTDLGFAPGSVDGDVNARTESAIYAYQREFGLPADGKPSMSLLTSLRSQISSNKNSTRRVDLPPIKVLLASNLRRSEITLYYECEREMNAERRNEGLPDIKLITQKEALR